MSFMKALRLPSIHKQGPDYYKLSSLHQVMFIKDLLQSLPFTSSLYSIFYKNKEMGKKTKQRMTHLLMKEVSKHELQLPSSSHEQQHKRNGWTLGRAIIEENSRHYNSLVCPFALCPYSSCFISTTFLLLLHDTSSPSNCTPRCYAQFCPVFIQRSIVKMVMSQS